MRLSDVMSHAGLAGYAEIAMVLFLVAFAAILVRTFARGNREEMDRAGRLPFEDGEDAPRPGARR